MAAAIQPLVYGKPKQFLSWYEVVDIKKLESVRLSIILHYFLIWSLNVKSRKGEEVKLSFIFRAFIFPCIIFIVTFWKCLLFALAKNICMIFWVSLWRLPSPGKNYIKSAKHHSLKVLICTFTKFLINPNACVSVCVRVSVRGSVQLIITFCAILFFLSLLL